MFLKVETHDSDFRDKNIEDAHTRVKMDVPVAYCYNEKENSLSELVWTFAHTIANGEVEPKKGFEEILKEVNNRRRNFYLQLVIVDK